MASSNGGTRPTKSHQKVLLGLGAAAVILVGGTVAANTSPASSQHDVVAQQTTSSPSRAAVAAETTSQAPSSSSVAQTTSAGPKPVAPVMLLSCPGAGTVASPVFGHRIAAAAPYSVVIDYGDGDRYTNTDQHLGAIFSHTYKTPGTFTVGALLTDATGQTTTATCAYSWSAPAPGPVVRGGGSGSGGSDTYTNVDGNQVHVPVAAPSAPPGATAKCNDGTWSFSQHHQGSCSGHGGVAEFLQ
jgi:hypothetical protein